MSYSHRADASYDAQEGFGSLDPGIYEGELISIAKRSFDSNAGKTFKVLDFNFKTVTGQGHTKTEFEQEEEKKQNNQVERIGYLLSRFVNKEKVETNNSQNWEEYRDWVIDTLGEANKGVAVYFKVIGNVWEGKATSDIPNYKGQIIRKDSGKTLSFSDSEKASNSEYTAAMSQKSDDPGDLPGQPEEGANRQTAKSVF